MTNSVFSADLRVYGDVVSKGDLDVHGHVEGSLSVKALTVARGATIEGSIRAFSADIAGRVDGVVECDRVAVEASGFVDGTVAYRTLSMKVGGWLNALCCPARDEAVGQIESAAASAARASGAANTVAAAQRDGGRSRQDTPQHPSEDPVRTAPA